MKWLLFFFFNEIQTNLNTMYMFPFIPEFIIDIAQHLTLGHLKSIVFLFLANSIRN